MFPISKGEVTRDALTQIEFLDLKEMEGGSAFVQPCMIGYKMQGKVKRWDMVRSHRSVTVLLYHSQWDALLMVRQFRPPVYARMWERANEKEEDTPEILKGFTYELCAGIVDKAGLTRKQIASEEVLEECGYHVPPDRLEYLACYSSAVGISGAQQSIYYAEITEADRAGEGGGVDGELIEVLGLPLEHVKAFVLDLNLPKSAGLMFGMYWLLDRLGRK